MSSKRCLPGIFRGWLKQFKDIGVVYCTVCNIEVSPYLADLKRHGKSKKHVMEVQDQRDAKARAASKDANAAVVMPWQMPEVKKKQTEWKVALHQSVDSGFRGMDNLCDFLKNELGSDRFDMSGEQCKELVEFVMAPTFKQDLKEDLQSAPFSLVLDETTDLASTRSVAVCTRYYSAETNDINTAFLGMLTIDRVDISAVADAIYNLIHEWDLDGNMMIGLVTDGISDLCPDRGTLLALLRNYCPNVVHLHSTFASLSLALDRAVKANIPCEVEFLLRESHNWFAGSAERQAQHKALVSAAGFALVQINGEEDEEMTVFEDDETR
jgi:hypothetical protein